MTQYTPPTSSEVRAILKDFGLSGSAAGKQLDMSSRQVRRYTGGYTEMPYCVLYTLICKNLGIQISREYWRMELKEIMGQS